MLDVSTRSILAELTLKQSKYEGIKLSKKLSAAISWNELRLDSYEKFKRRSMWKSTTCLPHY